MHHTTRRENGPIKILTLSRFLSSKLNRAQTDQLLHRSRLKKLLGERVERRIKDSERLVNADPWMQQLKKKKRKEKKEMQRKCATD